MLLFTIIVHVELAIMERMLREATYFQACGCVSFRLSFNYEDCAIRYVHGANYSRVHALLVNLSDFNSERYFPSKA